MATIAVHQPVEVIAHKGITHFINGGSCLQCSETEVYLTENGGILLGTIYPPAKGITYVNLDVHAPAPVKVAAKTPCYCDSVYHSQGC